jgi:hypothetical protein
MISSFKQKLPQQCQDIDILPRHKVALEHRAVGEEMWIVLLTTMPGDACKAWKLHKKEYWSLEPKHGSRDRYIRENYPPYIEGQKNPKQASLF